jgi:L-ascorbate metabolism protein UlaG (beta-lactamase superfamily)
MKKAFLIVGLLFATFTDLFQQTHDFPVFKGPYPGRDYQGMVPEPFAPEIVRTCTVTYIANEGFLVETASHKVLIDALFGNLKGNWCDQPGDSVLNLMISGNAPFDKINLLLVSHKHSDHFSAPLVIRFLRHHPETVLVCPGQVDRILQRDTGYSSVSGRIRSVRADSLADTTLHLDQALVRALGLKHGSWIEKDTVTGTSYDIHRDIENLGYLIETDGVSIFHSGDGSAKNNIQFGKLGMAGKEIDVAFFDRIFLRPEGMTIISEDVHARNIIFMHVEPGKAEYYRSVIKGIPEMSVLATPGEKKVFQIP